MAYPDATEVQSWGRPTFRVAKRIFIVVGSGMDRPHSIIFKPDAEERRAYIEDARFWVPPYWGPSGWLATGLAAAEVDWQEIAELIDTSYRLLAQKRHLKVLDTNVCATRCVEEYGSIGRGFKSLRAHHPKTPSVWRGFCVIHRCDAGTPKCRLSECAKRNGNCGQDCSK